MAQVSTPGLGPLDDATKNQIGVIMALSSSTRLTTTSTDWGIEWLSDQATGFLLNELRPSSTMRTFLRYAQVATHQTWSQSMPIGDAQGVNSFSRVVSRKSVVE